MSYTSILSGKPFLDSLEFTGFLYIRPTLQSLEGLDLPESPPFLFALLLTRNEITWARVFPLRLKLRFGAEMRYYPCPIWSVRDRKPVYREIGNTIMKLLCVSVTIYIFLVCLLFIK
jgi:MAD (mothers against decapentaplegic) interacting protein